MPEIAAYDVVVVVHDHAATLGSCLRAVAAMVPPPDSVAVVDNASRDGSAAIAAGFTVRLPLVLTQEIGNMGFSTGANRGLTVGAAPWVLLLNPDCAPAPDYAARLMAAAHGRRRVGAVTGKLLRADDDALTATTTLDAAGMVVTPSGRHFDRGAGSADDGRFDAPEWVFGGTGAATLYRRRALADVAYPDGQVFAETFFAYREDAELAWRLQWRGWRCLYAPDARAAHRRGLRAERGRAADALVNLHSVKNRFLLRAHCADWRWHLTCLPWWLVRDLAVVGACLTVERTSLPALRQAWQLRSDACERRRWVLERATEPPRRLRRWFRRGGWSEPVEAA